MFKGNPSLRLLKVKKNLQTSAENICKKLNYPEFLIVQL